MVGDNAIDKLIPVLFVALPLLFAGSWLLVIKFIANKGWTKFAERQTSDATVPADAKRYILQGLEIGERSYANYRGSMNGWVSDQGLFLRPALPFRAFHPLLHLRWQDIQSVEQVGQGIFKWANNYRLRFAKDLPIMKLSGWLGRAAAEKWAERTNRTIQLIEH